MRGGDPTSGLLKRGRDGPHPGTGMPGTLRVVVRPASGEKHPGEAVRCGCCGLRIAPRRARIWLAVGSRVHGEICAECVLRGPRGAAARLRERLRVREAMRIDAEERCGSAGWAGWMADRLRLLESVGSFPLPARQAAVREMRERR